MNSQPSYFLSLFSITVALFPSVSKGLMQKIDPDKNTDAFSQPYLKGEGESKRVLYYITKNGLGQVYITLGSSHHIRPGSVLNTYRYLQHGEATSKFRSGRIKIRQLMGNYAVAEVITQQELPYDTDYSAYPGVMAGDIIESPTYLVKKVLHTLPELEIPYTKLFTEPKAQPRNIELSKEGMEYLSRVMKVFGPRKISRMFISGYTGAEGQTQRNQVESYQRAFAVRQYLVTHLGFDPKRLTALGMGETGLKDPSNVSGHREANRRIVIKANTSASE